MLLKLLFFFWEPPTLIKIKLQKVFSLWRIAGSTVPLLP